MSNQLLNFNDLNTQDISTMTEDMTTMADEITNSVKTSIADAGIVDGTTGNDDLTGTIVSGLEGNDSLLGNGGSNVLSGNEGDDLLRGGTGVNIMSGGTGNDIIYAQGTSNVISGGDDGNDNDTIWLNGGQNSVGLMEGSGYDVINNFKLGSTTLFVENMDELSFVDSAEGTHIMQGEDLIAVSAGVSAEVFTQNTDAIFETFGAVSFTDGNGTVTFDDPSGTVIM